MINEIILIGKLLKIKGLQKHNGKSWYIITVGVEKPLRNGEGVYELEEIDCALWLGDSFIFEQKNFEINFLSIKGRLEKIFDESISVVVEKVKILDSHLSI